MKKKGSLNPDEKVASQDFNGPKGELSSSTGEGGGRVERCMLQQGKKRIQKDHLQLGRRGGGESKTPTDSKVNMPCWAVAKISGWEKREGVLTLGIRPKERNTGATSYAVGGQMGMRGTGEKRNSALPLQRGEEGVLGGEET